MCHSQNALIFISNSSINKARMRMLVAATTIFFVAIAAAQNGNVVAVEVGGVHAAPGFLFNPNVIRGRTGDIISFQFTGVPGNHSVTQSSFDDPCNPLPGGFDSGNVFINSTEATTPIFNLTITDDTKPIYFFCKQLNPTPHCGQGMVGAINPLASENDFDQFQSVAKAVGTLTASVGQGEGGLIGIGAFAAASVPSQAGVTIFTGAPVLHPTSDGVVVTVTVVNKSITSSSTGGDSIPTNSAASNGTSGGRVSHRLGHNTGVAIAVSLTVTLTFIILGAVIIMRRRARPRPNPAPNASGLILPFSDRPSVMRPTYNVPSEKQDSWRTRVANGDGSTKRRRGIEDTVAVVAGSSTLHGTHRPPVPSHLPHMEFQGGQNTIVSERTVAPNHTRYRMHEDAGSVRSMMPVEEEEVIDVPPNYSSIVSRFRRDPEEGSPRVPVPSPAVREDSEEGPWGKLLEL
ncbi:hypothetical protein D9613_009644 [Agrocybe pediades]|uniref:Extracellular serine-rich protein n=1 Tax=Agrocybe pediades TaxID=84607 RepID=A0A8H4R4R1_9AGAR|nr:hypothetical protein D9613_009644 [Agrocybe pediades]